MASSNYLSFDWALLKLAAELKGVHFDSTMVYLVVHLLEVLEVPEGPVEKLIQGPEVVFESQTLLKSRVQLH